MYVVQKQKKELGPRCPMLLYPLPLEGLDDFVEHEDKMSGNI